MNMIRTGMLCLVAALLAVAPCDAGYKKSMSSKPQRKHELGLFVQMRTLVLESKAKQLDSFIKQHKNDQGFDINQVYSGMTLAQEAARDGDDNELRVLAMHGADLNVMYKGQSLEDLATENGHSLLAAWIRAVKDGSVQASTPLNSLAVVEQ